MKVKDLFEVVKRKPGDTYSDEELADHKAASLKKKTTATNQLLELIRTKCKNNFDALASGRSTPLYRSTATTNYTKLGDYMFADITGRTQPRKSLTGSNYVLNYVSQAEDWKNVPKRDISTSCTPSYRDAAIFNGTTWLIIPYDDVTKFAKCAGDFNYLMKDDTKDGLLDNLGYIDSVIDEARDAAFEDDFRDIPGLEPILKNPILKLLPGTHRYSLKDLDTLSDCIEKLIYIFDDTASNVYKGNVSLRNLKRTLDDFEDNFGTRSLNLWFEDNITPTKLKIKVFNSLAGAKIAQDTEVWFEGNYVAIAADPGGYEETNKLTSSEWFKGIAKQV